MMKQRTKHASVKKNLRPFTILILALFSVLIANVASASGSKMPEVTTVDADMIDTGGPGAPIAEEYAHIDPENTVPKALLTKALGYYHTNLASIKNKEVIGVIDFSQHSSKERFYIIDVQSGRVEKYQVAHGKNSDPDNDGMATIFSNTPSSEMSSRGIYLTAETYYGGHGFSLKLDGKSSTNSNARSRAIVIHPADYVDTGGSTGRSWGCPALDPRFSEEIINQIKGGAVIYAQ